MDSLQSALHWLDGQQSAMTELLRQWVAINTASHHLSGLTEQAQALQQAFGPLGLIQRIELPPRRYIDDTGRTVDQPLGPLLHLRREPSTSLDSHKPRILLNIHYDTVHPPGGDFQQAELIDTNTLRGPGAVDAKGGIIVMLYALLALQHSGLDKHIALEVVLNPDEEIGSPGSSRFLQQRARACDLGLVYEPALPDGSLVLQRGGSGNFTLVVHGRAAHAGRDFDAGRNAITALAHAIGRLDALNTQCEGIKLNVARCVGGGPLNMVPELALARFNVRYPSAEQESVIQQAIKQVVADINTQPGFGADLDGGFYAPPKPATSRIRQLADHVCTCARQLGITFDWRDTAGVSDGNRLAAAGLPNIDTMGPRGGSLHSREEYVLLDSLPERAKLTALLIGQLALGELNWPLDHR